jgi:AcrR family transcriptional regulator
MSTSIRKKSRPYHHGELRATLLRAAGELLEEGGAAALSVREAARRAGVSHNAPYRHFPSRESLLAALAAEGFGILGEAMSAAHAAGGLRAQGEAYVSFALESPQRFRAMFGGELRIAEHPGLQQAASSAFEALSSSLAEDTAGQSARDASIAAWALVHGLAHLLLDERIATAARHGRSTPRFVRDLLSAVRFVTVRAPGSSPAQE